MTMTYEEAKEIVHKMDIKSPKEWKNYCKERKKHDHPNLPTDPPQFYKNKWVSWNDWLGVEGFPARRWVDYEMARDYIQSVTPRITNTKEWNAYCHSGKKPRNIPHSPQKIYEGRGWICWDAWFGNTGPQVVIIE